MSRTFSMNSGSKESLKGLAAVGLEGECTPDTTDSALAEPSLPSQGAGAPVGCVVGISSSVQGGPPAPPLHRQW